MTTLLYPKRLPPLVSVKPERPRLVAVAKEIAEFGGQAEWLTSQGDSRRIWHKAFASRSPAIPVVELTFLLISFRRQMSGIEIRF
jgi:hypothetical protein